MLPMIYMALVDDEDLPAFESLYENNKDGAFKSANKILQNDALSEECVQEVFLAIAKNFKTISSRDAQEQVKYLYISVRNRAYNIIKKEKPAKNNMPLYILDYGSYILSIQSNLYKNTILELFKSTKIK